MLFLALAAAPLCPGLGHWCRPDVPCAVERRGRDARGIERVVIEERVGTSVTTDGAVAEWLVYPGFEPFPAALGAFQTEVPTPHGTFRLCLLPSVAARQRRPAIEGQAPLEGGLVLLSFDPAAAGTPRFPLEPPFETAREEGLLEPAQAARLGELERLLPPRAAALGSAWTDFRRSPYLAHSRRELVGRIRSFADPQPAFSPDELRPERFFDRAQRERLRRKGHAIRGRCLISFAPAALRLWLEACPLVQLEQEWNRVRPRDAPASPPLRAAADRAHEEVERLSLELDGVSPEVAARQAFALLSAIGGLEPAPPPR